MLRIAKILKAYGKEGDVLTGGSSTFDLQEMSATEPVFIEFDGLPVPFFIEHCTPKGNSRAVWHLTGCHNLEDAEELVGRTVFIADEAGELPEEDFSGWTLFDRGRRVGVIDAMEPIPGNPCLRIGETLIPLHEDLVLDIDPDARTLDLAVPEGLLDVK
jgi:16S rRNA processing protein RimM